MVTVRIQNNMDEDFDMYEPVAADHPSQAPDNDGDDKELEPMLREDAEHAVVQRFVDGIDGALPAIMTKLADRKHEFKSAMVKVAYHRWQGLYDLDEHIRLRDALMDAVCGKTDDGNDNNNQVATL